MPTRITKSPIEAPTAAGTRSCRSVAELGVLSRMVGIGWLVVGWLVLGTRRIEECLSALEEGTGSRPGFSGMRCVRGASQTSRTKADSSIRLLFPFPCSQAALVVLKLLLARRGQRKRPRDLPAHSGPGIARHTMLSICAR
ncbi:hypothetical protein HDK64DRAFT_264353 [Phyllosticta capitalensis]